MSIAAEFDERVEAARAATDEGEFDLYIAAQGGANVPRDSQTVRVARNVTDEINAYERIERVVGIYAPHLGSELIHVTRTAEWRIVPKLLGVEPLTLKSGIAAPRSPVNNCEKQSVNADVVQAILVETYELKVPTSQGRSNASGGVLSLNKEKDE